MNNNGCGLDREPFIIEDRSGGVIHYWITIINFGSSVDVCS